MGDAREEMAEPEVSWCVSWCVGFSAEEGARCEVLYSARESSSEVPRGKEGERGQLSLSAPEHGSADWLSHLHTYNVF